MVGFYQPRMLLLGLLSLLIVNSTTGQSSSIDRPWGPGHFPPDESPQFFPPDIFGESRGRLAAYFGWYLRSMSESPLARYLDGKHPQVYRILLVPPVGSPLVVRLSFGPSGEAGIAAKKGRSNRHPDDLVLDDTNAISREAAGTFLKLLNDGAFWSAPTEPPFDLHHVVMGGIDCLLEGEKEGRYHAVDRKDAELGPLKSSFVYLVVGLAKIDLPSEPGHR